MVDQFITSLHTLAKHCLYGPLKEEMICDRLKPRHVIDVGSRHHILVRNVQLEKPFVIDIPRKVTTLQCVVWLY